MALLYHMLELSSQYDIFCCLQPVLSAVLCLCSELTDVLLFCYHEWMMDDIRSTSCRNYLSGGML